MNGDFDGLRAILGDAESPAPEESHGLIELDPPLDQVSPQSSGQDDAASGARMPQGPGELEDLERQPAAPALENDPGLLDLDHGVYDGDSRNDSAVRPRSSEEPREPVAAGAHPRSNDSSLGVDGLEDLFGQPGASADDSDPADRKRGARKQRQSQAGAEILEPLAARATTDWTPAAVVVLGMLFGASAALLMFHKQVTQIVAQWG
jgi:hypothetical protein